MSTDLKEKQKWERRNRSEQKKNEHFFVVRYFVQMQQMNRKKLIRHKDRFANIKAND